MSSTGWWNWNSTPDAGGGGSGGLSIETHHPPPIPTAGLSEYDHQKLSDETAALIVARLIEHWRQKP